MSSHDELFFELPAPDRARFPAADGALRAWSDLPAEDRHGPAGKGMLELARSLLSSEPARRELAQRGFDLALSLDDSAALRLFLSHGAQMPPIETPSPERHSAYSFVWERGLTQWCVRHEKLHCFDALAELGRLEQERSAAAPFLKEPEPSPLAQVDRAFLTQHAPGLGSDGSQEGTDLILLLLRGMEEQSSHLSLQISEAELRQGNPLLALLWRARDGQSQERPLDLLRRAAFDHRLFEPALATHRNAMLGAAADGSLGALYLCVEAGVSPEQASLSRQRDLACALASQACDPGPFSAEWLALAPRFFEPWAQASEPIAHRALEALIERSRHGPSHERQRSIRSLELLCSAWAKGESPAGLLPPADGAFVRARLDQLASARLQGVDEARAEQEKLAPTPAKAREAQQHWERDERLIERAIAALQPLSSAPKMPARRM